MNSQRKLEIVELLAKRVRQTHIAPKLHTHCQVLRFCVTGRNVALTGVRYLLAFFFGRPPRFPFSRAAAALADEVDKPPTLPPFRPISARYFVTALFIAFSGYPNPLWVSTAPDHIRGLPLWSRSAKTVML
jgi:hypothetical protein